MGIQINGNNDIISALDGSWTAEGASINTSGILTATTFKGNIVGTAATFTGPVTIGGTLTYEDVTNIDSVGIITARDGLKVLGGGANVVGVVTATSFVGGLPISNGADNRVITASSASAIRGESALTFSGGDLQINANSPQLRITESDTSTSCRLVMAGGRLYIQVAQQGQGSSTSPGIMYLTGYNNTDASEIHFKANNTYNTGHLHLEDGKVLKMGNSDDFQVEHDGSNTYLHNTTGDLVFQNDANIKFTKKTGGVERLRITSTGKVGINSTSPTYALEVDGGTQNTVIAVRSSDAKAAISFLDSSSNGYGRATIGGEGDSVYITTGGGTERIRFGTGGNSVTTGISTTANLVTGSEVLSVRGYSSFKSTSKDYAAIYTHNEGNTSGSYNAHILWNANGANRGGIGYMPNTGDVIINNQNALIFATGGTHFGGTERLRIKNTGGVGINTSLIRNNRFVNIAAPSQDYTSGSTNLTDGGGIMFQHTDSLASTGRTYPGIFWSGNTSGLGRARAGILGITASNNDATDIAFLTRYAADGTAFYPTDEKMRITSGGQIRLPVNGQELAFGASQQFRMFWENSESRGYLKTNGAYGLAFRINNGNRIEINGSSGDVTMQGASGRNFQWDNSDASLYLTDNNSGSSARLKVGSGGDLQLYHDVSGTNHITCANNHHLKLSAQSIQFYDYTGNTQYLRVKSGNDRVRVYGESAVDGTSSGADGLSIAVNGGTSCPLYFGTETDVAQKSMYLKGYWIYLRGHVNEGMKFIFSQGGAAPHGNIYEFKYNSAKRPGNSTTWDNFSDSRAKENVQSITNGIEKIKQLRPVTFDWTDDYADSTGMWKMDKSDPKEYNWVSKKENGYDTDAKNGQYGFLAQEYETVLPKDVKKEKFTLGDTEISDFRSLNHDSLIATLTAALKEAIAKIEVLETEVAALKGS